MGKKLLICSVIAFSIIFSACGSDEKKSASIESSTSGTVKKTVTTTVEMADKDFISKPASLSKNLPASTMTYLRLPTLKNSLSPTGTALDPAIGNKAMAEQIKAIYSPLFKKVTGLTEGAHKFLAELLLSNAVSPIELALLQPPNPQMPFPTIVIKLGVENESHDSIQAKIDGLSQEFPVVVSKKLSKSESGQFAIGPFTMFVDFDEKAESLSLVGAHMAVMNAESYQQVLSSITPNDQHPMLKLEKEVDTSGKGLFAWFGIDKMLPLYKSAIPPQTLSELQASGIDQAKSVVIGSGAADGKAKLSMLIEMPDAGFKQYIYKPNNSYDFTTAGEPRYVLSLALPTKEQITQTEVLISKNLPKEIFEEWMNTKTQFSLLSGVSFDDIFKAINSELVAFGDDSGDFIAIKLNDKAAFKTVLDNLVYKFQLKYEVREHKGQQYHHLVIPNASGLHNIQLEKLAANDPVMKAYLYFLQTFQGHSHAYWIESGDYLIMASIPQLLMDRLAHENMTNVSNWLEKTQKVDPSKSLFLIATTIDDLPKTIYKFQLGMMNYLNDVANSNAAADPEDATQEKASADKTGFDIFKLPTPAELNLPKYGTYSMQYDISDTRMALNITSDFSAADILLTNNGLTTVAITGILAAVAIPAYQDYTLKAKVQESYIGLKSYTHSVEAHYMSNKKFPSSNDIANFDLEPFSEIAYSLTIAPDTGIITGIFDPKMNGVDLLTLRLIPEISGEQIFWSCEATGTETKLAPAECL